MKEKVQKLQNLIEQFHTNIIQYKNSNYDEANTRVDFIDKFFELLDWDVRNKQGYSEDYRDVVREDKVIIQGKPKAPDYSFRIGKERKFFVEAKKPSVNIKKDIGPAYQIRRYGYTAKVPLSILTDFEEFAVYDTRIKPKQNDKASVGRIFYCTFQEYEKNFEFIYNTFAKRSILKGSFDRYVIENKNKRGTSEVDDEFLKLIENWRNNLAKNIALRNLNLSIYNLNTSVQKIIDRIIFLRIAEDRNMETYGTLEKLINNENIYQQLVKIFIKADKKYNSGLFKQTKWLNELQIDDKILKKIIQEIYYPKCPYELSIMPIEVLGNIYEQFLGKIIRLTPSHQAKVEEKPEVKKAGGVYYTPQYIVEYIVKNTVGEKLKKKNPNEIAKLKILDPACGSGSFLVGTYQYLLDDRLKFYTKKKNIKIALRKGVIYQVDEETFRLSIAEKKSILLNNIFGVDIDKQAVEVTKLSLLLKLMEDENTESANSLFKHSDFQLLPNLSDNIKCGNSLIGSDFYDNTQIDMFDDEQIRKINVFDWEDEFSEIFASGGFDCIIGNPPYVNYENLDKTTINYVKYERKYVCANKPFDIFQLFLEKSYFLISEYGFLGFIFPNLFLKGMNYVISRKFFYEKTRIISIKNYGDHVFKKVQMPTCVMITEKNVIKNTKTIFYIKHNNKFSTFDVKQKMFNNDGYKYIYENICERLKKGKKTLNDLVKITRGLEIGKNKIIKNNNGVKIIFGKDICRYFIKSVSFINQDTYRKYKKNEDIFKNEKIIIRETGTNITAVYEEHGQFTNRSLYCIRSEKLHIKWLLAIINSKLIQYYYENQFRADTNIFPKIRIGQVKQIPIPKLNLENKKEKAQHDKLVSLVDQMLAVQKKYHTATSEEDKKFHKQKIDVIDRQIDKLVYGLYGLSDKEIKVIEG